MSWDDWRLVPEEIKGTEFEQPFRARQFARYIDDYDTADVIWLRMLQRWQRRWLMLRYRPEKV